MMDTTDEGNKEHGDEGNKRGRPRGKGRNRLEILTEGAAHPCTARRRTASSSISKPPLKKKTPPATTPRQKDPCSSSSRPSYYIIEKAPTILPCSKLPKSGAVQGLLLSLLDSDHSLKEASKLVTSEVKAVWLHHFGHRLIMGKQYGR